MNVLFIDCARELGGPQRSLLELATALAADGLSVHAAVPAGPLADALRASAITVQEIPAVHFHRRWGLRKWMDAARWFRALVAVGRVTRSIQPDILHANDTVSATIAAQYRRNRIVVWHIRGLFVPSAALHYLLRRVTAIVAISEAVEENLMDRVFSFQRSKIHLLLENPEVARQQGIAARKHILAEFDIARTAREVRGLYSQLMEAKSRDVRRTREEKEERRQRSHSSSGW